MEIDENLILGLDDNTPNPIDYKGSAKNRTRKKLLDEQNMMNTIARSNRGVGFYKSVTPLAPVDSYWEEGETMFDLQRGQNEYLAEQQGYISKLLNTLGQGVGTFGTTVASTIATLGSLPYAALNEAMNEGDQDTMGDILRNPVMRGIAEIDKQIKEELLPTYYTKEQQDRLFSAATVTDAVNGVGFLLSAIVPNSLITKGFGSLSKIVALQKAGKLTNSLDEAIAAGTLSVDEAAKIGKVANIINKTGEVTGALVGRLGESAMEANQTYDELIANGATEDEARQQSNNVFNGNMLLGLSDFNQATRWFNRGGGIADDIIKSGGKYAIKKKGFGEFTKDLLTESLQEAGEEGYQFLLQKGAGKAADMGFLNGVLSSTDELFNTVEGQKSMLLGAVLGGGASAAFGALNKKQKNEHLNQVVNELNTNPTFKDRYIINESGERILNPEFVASANQFAYFEQEKAKAIANKDQDAFNLAESLQFSNLVASRKKAEMLDDFITELDALGKSTPAEMKAMFGELPIDPITKEEMTPSQVASKYKTEAKRISQMIDGIDAVPQFANLSSQAKNVVAQALITQDAIKKAYSDLKGEVNALSLSDNPLDLAVLEDKQKKSIALEKEYQNTTELLNSLLKAPEKAESKAEAKKAAIVEREEEKVQKQVNQDKKEKSKIQQALQQIQTDIEDSEAPLTVSDYEMVDVNGEVYNITNTENGTQFFDKDGNDVTKNFFTNHPKAEISKKGTGQLLKMKVTDVDLEISEEAPEGTIVEEDRGYKKTSPFVTAGRNSLGENEFNEEGDRRDLNIAPGRQLYFDKLAELSDSNQPISLKLEVAPREFEGKTYTTPVIKAILYVNGKPVEKDGVTAYTVLHESNSKNLKISPEERKSLQDLRDSVVAREEQGFESFVTVESISNGFLNERKGLMEQPLSTLKDIPAVSGGGFNIAVSMIDLDTGIPVIEHNGQKVNVKWSGRPYLAVKTGIVNGKPKYVYHELETRNLVEFEVDNIMIPLIKEYLEGARTKTIANKEITILSYDPQVFSVLDMFAYFGNSSNKATSMKFEKVGESDILYFGETGHGPKNFITKENFDAAVPLLRNFLLSKKRTVSNKHLGNFLGQRNIPVFKEGSWHMVKTTYADLMMSGVPSSFPPAVYHNISTSTPHNIFLNKYLTFNPKLSEQPNTKVKAVVKPTPRVVTTVVNEPKVKSSGPLNIFQLFNLSKEEKDNYIISGTPILPIPDSLKPIVSAWNTYTVSSEGNLDMSFLDFVKAKFPNNFDEVLNIINGEPVFTTLPETVTPVEKPIVEEKLLDKKADIERRRQEELKPYDERDAKSLEAIMPNNPNHPTFKVGMKFNQGMNIIVKETLAADNYDGREDAYEAITAIISPAEFGEDGKMTKAAEVKVTLFNTKEDANKAIQEKYEKVQSKVGQKQKQINAKYDAELAALETPKAAEIQSELNTIKGILRVDLGGFSIDNVSEKFYDNIIHATADSFYKDLKDWINEFKKTQKPFAVIDSSEIITKYGAELAVLETPTPEVQPEPITFSTRTNRFQKKPLPRKVGNLPYKVGDIESAKAWVQAKLGVTPNVAEGLIKIAGFKDSYFGYFQKGAITLSDILEEGTEYHEAFHLVSQMHLSRSERESLYNEAREVNDKIVTDLQAEEYLAEKFREYVMSSGKAKFPTKQSSIFSRLWNFIKSLLGLNTTTVNEVFAKLNEGYYNKASYINRLGEGSSDLTLFSTFEVTPHEAMKIEQALLAYFRSFIASKNQTFADFELADNLPEFNTYAKEKMAKFPSAFNASPDEFLATFKEKTLSDLGFEFEEDEELDVSRNRGETYTENSKVSGFVGMSKKIDFLFNTIVDQTTGYTEYGHYPIIPSSEVKAYLANLLHDTFSLEEMFNKLNEVANREPETEFEGRNAFIVYQILDSLGNMTPTQNEVLLHSEFFDAMSLVYQSMLTQIHYSPENHVTLDSMVESVKNRIRENWTNNLRATDIVEEVDGQKFIRNFDSLAVLSAEDFIQTVGLDIKSKMTDEFKKAIVDFKTAIKNLPKKQVIIDGKTLEVTTPFWYTNSVEEALLVNSDKRSKAALAEWRNTLRALVDLEVASVNAITENQSKNTEGETVYAFAKPSFLFQKIAAIKNGASKYISVQKSKLWDAIAEGKVEIALVDGQKVNETGEVGQHISTLTEEELLLHRINGMFGDKNKYPTIQFLQMADKKSVYGLIVKDQYLICKPNDVTINDGFLDVPDSFIDRLYDIYQNYQEFDNQTDIKDRFTVNSATKLFDDLGGPFADKSSFSEAIKKELYKAYVDVKAFTKNFKSSDNKYNALTEITNESITLDKVLGALVTTEMVTNLEQMNIFFGNPAFYKDLFKRTPAIRANGRIPSVDNHINEFIVDSRKKVYGEEYASALPSDSRKFKAVVNSDIEVTSKYAEEYKEQLGITEYGEVNATDAQGFMTFPFYREYMMRTGQWSKKLEKQFFNELNGTSDEKAAWPPLKLVHFGAEANYSKEFVPVYYKFSVYPLVPSLIKGRRLEQINNNMLKTGTSVSVFNSGNKVGNLKESKKNSNVYNEIQEQNTHTLFIQDLKIQVDISAKKEKWEQLFGTQIRKLITQNIADAGKDMKDVEDYNEYVSIISDLVTNELRTLADSLDTTSEELKTGTLTEDAWKKLIDLFKQSAIEREESDNIIFSLDYLKDQSLTIDALPTRDKVQNLMNALINNRILKQKMFGRAYVQCSSVGFEYATEKDLERAVKQGVVLKDSEFYRSHFVDDVFDNSKARLGFINKKDKKVIVSEILLPYWFKGKFENITDIPPILLESLGYRIPTQGLNSMLAFKVVGFLPKSMDQLAAVPYEITMQAGSDFDVDKINMFLRNYIKKKDALDSLKESPKVYYENKVKGLRGFLESVDKYTEQEYQKTFGAGADYSAAAKLLNTLMREKAGVVYDETAEFTEEELEEILKEKGTSISDLAKLKEKLAKMIENPEKYMKKYTKQLLQDRLLDLMIKRLSDPDRFQDYISPNSAKNLNDQAIEINNSQQEAYKVTVDYKGMKQFWSGTGIKVGKNFWSAKAGVGQSASQGTFTALTQLSPLSQVYYSDRLFVPKGYVNLDETGNILFGKKDNTVGHPIIDLIANQHLSANVDAAKDPFIFQLNANNATNDIHYYLLAAGVPDVWVNRFMTQPIILEYVKRMAENKGLIAKMTRVATGKVKSKNSIIEDVRKMYGGEGVPSEYIQSSTNRDKDKNGKSIPTAKSEGRVYDEDQLLEFIKNPDNAAQLNILDDFLFYSEWAMDRRNVISSLKFDTQGAGKNLPESKIYAYKYGKALRFSMFAGIESLVRTTIVAPFRDNVLDVALNMYKDTVAVAKNPSIELVLSNAMDILYENMSLKPENLYKVYGMLTNIIIQNNLENKKEWFGSNVYGENSVAKRISKLIRSKEFEGNYLFEKIIIVDFAQKENEPDIVKFDNTIRIDKNLENIINEGFREFKFKQPALYRDLIKLSLFQTGVIVSPVSFYRYIPVEDFVEVVKDLIKGSKVNTEDAVKKLVQNLPLLPGLAPKISKGKIVVGKIGLPDILEIAKSGKPQQFITRFDYREGLGLYEYAGASENSNIYSKIPITGNHKLYNGIIGDETKIAVTEESNEIEETVEESLKGPINIYAGTGENADLSNFAIRPFTTSVETSSGSKTYTFQSVEQGFHFMKAVTANNPTIAKQILQTINGGQLKRLTNRQNLSMTSEQIKQWDDTSKSIMLNLMYDSYVQNPQAAERLVSTGNAKITHNQDNTRWKNDFPEVVMTVRDMLREEGFNKTQSSWDMLSEDNRFGIERAGISPEEFNDMSEEVKQITIKCYGSN